MHITDEFMDQWGKDLDSEMHHGHDVGEEPGDPATLVCRTCQVTLR